MNIGELVATLGVDATGLHMASREMEAFEKQMQTKVTTINTHLKSMGDKMKTFGRDASKYLTLPLTVVGGASFKMYKDFDSNMAKITGLVGVAREEVNAWRDDVISMAPAVAKSTGELSNALYFITSAGIRGSAAMEVLEMSAKAATAGLGDTATVADLATSAINAYGVANLSAEKAVDILVATVREGKAVPEELAQSMGQVLPIAAEMGVGFDQVGAMMAAMTRTGTNAATSATQLRQILASMIKPTKMAEDALAGMGTSSAELRKTIKDDGLLAALMNVKDLTGEYGEEIMARVFPNIRALSGILDIMGSNMEDNIRIFNQMKDTTGTLNKAFEEATNTVEFKYNQAIIRAKTGLTVLGETVSQAALPLIEKFGKVVENLTRWFQELDERNKRLIVTLGGILATVGPLTLALGFLVGNILPMMITGAMGAVKAFNALRLAMLANPVTAIAVGVLALSAAVYGLVKNMNKAGQEYNTWTDLNNKASQAIVKERVELEKLVRIVKSNEASKEQQAAAIKKINQLSPEYLGNLTAETIETGKAETAIRNYILALEQRARVTAAEEALVELEKERLKAIQEGTNAQLTFWEKASKGGLMYAAGLNILYKKSSILANEEQWSKEKLTAAEERYQSLKRTYIGIIDTQIKKEDELNQVLSKKEDGGGGTKGVVDQGVLNMLKQLAVEEENVRKLNIALGDSFDENSTLVQLFTSVITDLIKEGVEPGDAAIQTLVSRLNELRGQIDTLELLAHAEDELTKSTKAMWDAADKMFSKDNAQMEYMERMEQVFLDTDIAIAQTTTNAQRFGESFNQVNAQIEIYSQALQTLQNTTGPITEEQQAAIDYYVAKLKELKTVAEEADETQRALANTYNDLSSALSQMGSAIDGTAGSWLKWAAGVLRDIPKIITGITALTSATAKGAAVDSGAAVAGATKEGAKQPFPINLIAIVAGVAAVMAALASIPKAKQAAQMKTGGVVPPGYPNDSYPALLTSGEKVVPPGKLPEFEKSQVNVHVTVEGRVKGRDILYVMKEELRRNENVYR